MRQLPTCSSLPDNDSSTTRINHKSNDVVYPRLGLRVLFVGSCFLAGAISMFAAADCVRAKSFDEADLVVFLGGEDVDPSLYGEKPLRGTYFNVARDKAEIDIFTECVAAGKPMFGICRGMQFLHVMNGGKLWQHVENHAIGGTHAIRDLVTGEVLQASSMHHQMCIEDENTFPLAYSTGRSGRYCAASHELSSDRHDDLEAAIYPNINAVCVQGHPEVSGTPEYTAWSLGKIEEFLDELALMGHNSKPATIDANVVPPRIS
jgi:GMP synthase-like glutamine amidotransferase